MNYITSDLHLSHKNIIKHCNRPFKTVDEQDRALFNELSKITEHDTLYFLGDLAMFSEKVIDKFMSVMKGKLIFIVGNHDHQTIQYLRSQEKYKNRVKIHNYLEIYHNNKKVVLFHYPILEWNKSFSGSVHLYGHRHGKFNHEGKSLDVGWDNHHKILTLDEAVAIADSKPINKFN